MTVPLEIRRDRTPAVLRKEAKAETDARIARRILAIANALDGMSREQAARAAGMHPGRVITILARPRAPQVGLG